MSNIQPQTFENTSIALNFLQDNEMYYLLDGNKDYNHQFPMYGWILIGFFKVFGFVLLPVQVFQILLNAFFAIVVLQIFRITVKHLLIKPWMEYALLLISLFHPLLFYYQLFVIHPVTLDVLFFALLVLVSLRWIENLTFLNSLVLIFTIGFTVLERSTLIFALVPSLLLAFKQWRILLKLVLITSVSVVLFLSPWVARNYDLTGKMQLTSGTWRYLWVGIQEETNGTNVVQSGESYYALFPEDVGESWSSRSLEEQLEFYKKEYLKKWDAEPSHILKMWGIKLKNMFWFSSHAGSSSNSNVSMICYKIGHLLLLLVFIFGLYGTRNKTLLVLFIGALCFALVQSFFYVETRHAMPFQFIFWIGALIGLDDLIQRTFRINS